ncbi:hypothetical protein MYX76_07430 [Desulfobacterota bacterium AH_259_B03_O07]|nr:hypothetical protein [Desulfobacterota bacterium AH_259_B03_O07]
MKEIIFSLFVTLFLISPIVETNSFAQEDRYQVVIEESFYVVKPENKDKFLEIYKGKIYPFWNEMKKMGLIDGDIKMYSQRLHTLEPRWTFKTIIRFKNYNAIDTWLKKRDEVFDKLFPNAGGYQSVSKEISEITEEHWDEFIREIPLKK